MFHLGWFMGLGFGVYGWNQPWSGNVAGDVGSPELFIDAATALERAGFDYIMLEDSSVLPDVYEGSFAHSLRKGTIRFDPVPLVTLLARSTEAIGIIATINTTFYPPFLAARLLSSLDHVTRGRVGINLVTGSPHSAAKNYGLSQLPEHDLRYDMAGEWMRAVRELWDSWDEDALVADEDSGVYIRAGSVQPINFEGRYFRTRGPLNTLPGPQRHPVVCQAGGSPAGRDVAAEHADTVVCSVDGVDAMRDFREDMSLRLEKHGRARDDLKVLFLVDPILGDTDAEAEARAAARADLTDEGVTDAMAGMSYISGFDFSTLDPDQPVPHFESNGHQSLVDAFHRQSVGKTLRQVLTERSSQRSVRLVGAPATVADQMVAAMEHAGGDGFLVSSPVTRRNLTLIADGLCPELRRREAIRSSYTEPNFRANLAAY